MEGETTFPAAPRRVSLWSGALTLALPTSALRVRKLQRQEHTAAVNLPPPKGPAETLAVHLPGKNGTSGGETNRKPATQR